MKKKIGLRIETRLELNCGCRSCCGAGRAGCPASLGDQRASKTSSASSLDFQGFPSFGSGSCWAGGLRESRTTGIKLGAK